MRTQWRCGAAGFYGLDLSVLTLFEERLGIPADRRDDVFASLLIMQDAALAFFAEQRARTNGR